MWKSSLLVRWNETFIVGKNPTKCWFSVNTSDKFPIFSILMSLFKSSCFGVTFGLGAAWGPAVVWEKEKETASVGVVARCERDRKKEGLE